METLGSILDKLAWYHIFGLFILFAIIFGKKKDWEYEAKLFEENSTLKKGEIEIEKFSKENPQAEFEIHNADLIKGKQIEILINNSLISKFEVDNKGCHLRTLYPENSAQTSDQKSTQSKKDRQWNKIRFAVDANLKPDNNDKVVVKINGTPTLNGVFFRD